MAGSLYKIVDADNQTGHPNMTDSRERSLEEVLRAAPANKVCIYQACSEGELSDANTDEDGFMKKLLDPNLQEEIMEEATADTVSLSAELKTSLERVTPSSSADDAETTALLGQQGPSPTASSETEMSPEASVLRREATSAGSQKRAMMPEGSAAHSPDDKRETVKQESTAQSPTTKRGSMTQQDWTSQNPETKNEAQDSIAHSPEVEKKTAIGDSAAQLKAAPDVMAGDSCTDIIRAVMQAGGCSLGQRVQKIQAALTAATRKSHCHSCLQDNKSQAPDLVCLDCSLSYCFRCSGRHKSTPSSNSHTMLPVTAEEEEKEEEDGQRKDSRWSPGDAASELRGLSCFLHGKEWQLFQFCQNCEVLMCARCLQEQHLQCPEKGKVLLQEYAREERESIKRCRVKYAQVMRFFSEQRRDTEERLAALSLRKQTVQGEVRKFFSVLIKACMDVEGSLLEELENTVTDHMDLLTGQSRAWKQLHVNTQQLLDITEVLHFLPTADFLPLVEASKSSLTQALREGESLAATTPPEMSMELCLAQSSQGSVVKRIKEIGATALTVITHKTLTLRKVMSMSLSTADDKTDPLVTSMTLLTPSTLLAADFNNFCLKRLQKDDEGAGTAESWNCTEVLPLKWRPYGLTKLSEDDIASPSSRDGSRPEGAEHQDSGMTSEHNSSSEEGRQSAEQQAGGGTNSQGSTLETMDVEIHLAVTSPFAGCFEVVVPLAMSSHRRMRVVRTIDEEKGFWGLGLVGEHKLALSTIASGRSYMSLVDTAVQQNPDSTTNRVAGASVAAAASAVQRLPLTSDTSLTPLVSPRHVLPTTSSSFIVGDHGKNAVIHASVDDGKVLFSYTGNGSQRVSRPEGICMDPVQGYIYVADSGDHSILVLTKGGHLYSKTGSKQSDLSCPQALCMDRNSRLYVANEGGKLLVVYEVFQDS